MAAPAMYDHGTRSATGGEDSIFNLGSPGLFQVILSLAEMDTGDTVIVRRYIVEEATDAQVLVEELTFNDAQAVDGILLGPIGVATETFPGTGAAVSIEQTAGTLRDFGWTVLAY